MRGSDEKPQEHLLFLVTDKSKYKPGQRINIRILSLDIHLKAKETLFEVALSLKYCTSAMPRFEGVVVSLQKFLSICLVGMSVCLFIALWSGTNKNRDVSTGPLAPPFARSFARTARSFARTAHSLARS